MIYNEIFGLLIISANVIISYFGFTNSHFFESCTFHVDRILIKKEYKRLITSGFIHLDWGHLIFNMLSLFFFYDYVEMFLGNIEFVILYFGSLLGGNLLALYIHRQHGDYSAAGASGAVSGVIFASIALFPGMGVGAFLIPVHIPG